MLPYSSETLSLIKMRFAALPEKEKRHFAALESIKLGWGGVSYISKVLSINRKTISKGKQELKAILVDQSLSIANQRKAGGGRKKKNIF
jgi:hypothetical protein